MKRSVMGRMFHSSVPEILGLMAEDRPMNACDMARRLGIDNSGLLRTLKRLQTLGVTERKAGSDDWGLTPKGWQVATAMTECARTINTVLDDL